MDVYAIIAVATATLVLVGASVVAMAIGVLAKRPCLRGSCGGPEVIGADGQKVSCEGCPNRKR
jgi:hypothetical protein